QSSNVLIEANYMHTIGRFGPGENGCQPSTMYYQNHDHGIYWDSQPTNVIIRNNLFQTIKHGWAIQLWNGTLTDFSILHNTFIDGNDYRDGSYIVLWSGTHNNYAIKNNIFGKPKTGIIDTQKASDTNFNNCFFDYNLLMPTTSGGTPIVLDSAVNGTFTIGTHNLIGTDPLFVNAASGDFHLQSNS